MVEKMFLESRSKYAFDETMERLNQAIKDGGWGVQHTHDLQGTMTKKGYDVLAAKVIELCKPQYAYKLLSADEWRIFTTMMPCRISVYDKSDGHTYISRMNNGVLAAQIGGVVEEVMGGAYKEVEQFLAQVLE